MPTPKQQCPDCKKVMTYDPLLSVKGKKTKAFWCNACSHVIVEKRFEVNDVVSSGFFGFVPLISKTPGDFASEFKCADFSSIAAYWRTYLIVDVRRLPDLLWAVNYLPVKSCFSYAEIPYDVSIFP